MRCAWVPVLALCACGPRHGAPLSPAGRDPDALPAGADLRLGDPRWRMPGSVDAIAFTADERDVAVASREGGVVVFDVATGRRRARVADLGHPSSLAMLDDRHVLVGGGIDVDGTWTPGPPAVIDLATGAIEHRPALARLAAAEVTASADGRAIVLRTDEDHQLAVVDGTGARLRDLDRSRNYAGMAVVGNRVIATRDDATIGIWDLATGSRMRVFGAGGHGVASLSARGDLVATGSWPVAGTEDVAVDVYRLADGGHVATIAHPCAGLAAFSPDGGQLALLCPGGLWIHAMPSGEQVATLPVPRDGVAALAWSPTGRWLAFGGGDNEVHLVDTRTWRAVPPGTGHAGGVRLLAVGADGRVVASGPSDRRAEVWGPDGGLIGELDLAGALQAIDVGADGVVVAYGTTGRVPETTIARDPAGGGHGSLRLPSPSWFELRVSALRARRDGEVVAIATDALRVLAPRLDAELWRYDLVTTTPDGLPAYVAAAISRDGSRAAIETGDDEITILDLDVRAPLDTVGADLCGLSELAFTGDRERLLAVDAQHRIYRLDTVGRRVVAAIELPDQPAALAWLPSGEVLILAEDTLYAWARTGDVTATPLADATALAASATGAHVYVGLRDGTVLRYPWSALRDRARPFTARTPGACEAGGNILGGLMGREAGPTLRGMLDNSQPHEGPVEPDAPSE